jgi:hypothetical protein
MRRLKTGAVVRRSFGILLNIPFLARATGIWLVLLALGYLAISRVPAEHNLIADVGYSLLLAIAAAAWAVNVHRFILLHEPPAPLRIKWTEIHYVLRAIWICWPVLLVVAAVGVLIAIFWHSHPPPEVFTASPIGRLAAWGTAGLIIFVMVVPLALSLPALAIGNKKFRPVDGFDAIAGNLWPFLAAYILVVFLPSALLSLASPLLGKHTDPAALLPDPVAQGIDVVVSLIGTVLFAAMLSCTYAGLVLQDSEFASGTAEGGEIPPPG